MKASLGPLRVFSELGISIDLLLLLLVSRASKVFSLSDKINDVKQNVGFAHLLCSRPGDYKTLKDIFDNS